MRFKVRVTIQADVLVSVDADENGIPKTDTCEKAENFLCGLQGDYGLTEGFLKIVNIECEDSEQV